MHASTASTLSSKPCQALLPAHLHTARRRVHAVRRPWWEHDVHCNGNADDADPDDMNVATQCRSMQFVPLSEHLYVRVLRKQFAFIIHFKVRNERETAC